MVAVAPDKQPKRRFSGAVSQRLMRVGFFRRMYIKRMLRYVDKSKEKGRKLPPEFAEMARFLSRVPKNKRFEALEDAIMTQQTGGYEAMGRDLRRAAAAQQRRSGKGHGYRPGMPPGAIQQGRQQAKGRAKGR